jgi:hypothetical protein
VVRDGTPRILFSTVEPVPVRGAVGLGLDWFPGSEIGSEKIRAQVFIMASGSCNGYKIIIFSD